MNKKLHELQKQNDELKLGWQRCQADFDNFQKRVSADKERWSESARTETFEKILPVLDNLHLTLLHVPQDLKENSWIQGVEIVAKQIDETLRELGIEKIEPKIGDSFDPAFHEAVEVVTAATDKKHKSIKSHSIIRLARPGYKIADSLIRPARVVVAE
ncbi:MAG: nucleotide exchange factor GrpE [Candidatus Berkelbacteria bacterium]|nr:nucleotide exchange factor GrpE [Candidatus Berkelbacteria bacterium]